MEENIINLFNQIRVLNSENSDIDKILNENVLYLAFIGDAIFDTISRDYILKYYHNKYKIVDIHKTNIKIVCASSQSNIIDYLITNNLLDEKEIEIYKHGRNAHNSSKSKNSGIVAYRKATGFEVLLGYLFYDNNIKRMCEIAILGIEHIINANIQNF